MVAVRVADPVAAEARERKKGNSCAKRKETDGESICHYCWLHIDANLCALVEGQKEGEHPSEGGAKVRAEISFALNPESIACCSEGKNQKDREGWAT